MLTQPRPYLEFLCLYIPNMNYKTFLYLMFKLVMLSMAEEKKKIKFYLFIFEHLSITEMS